MRNDEREQLDRRVNDQWARRMRALEREFERADRARHPKPERHSIPLAIVSGLVVILTAVLILTVTRSGPDKPVAQPPPVLGPFGTTPAAHWDEPPVAIRLPAPARSGSFSAAAVQSAMDDIRTYLVNTRTEHTALARGNALTAAVRADGVLSYRHLAKSRHAPEQLVVSVNVVWAYALRAEYPLAPGANRVVALHERAEFRLPAGTPLKVQEHLVKDRLLWFDNDCGYRAAGLVALPRANDPAALPGYSNGVSMEQAFDIDTTAQISGHVCR